MFGFRNEFRGEAQEKYGHYCSYARSNDQEPIPYHLFTEHYSKGLTVKEIHNKFSVRSD